MSHLFKQYFVNSQKINKRPEIRYFKCSISKKRKGDSCCLCNHKGHFAKNYPNKIEQAAKLVQQKQVISALQDNDDIESLFSKQDVDDYTFFALVRYNSF